MFEEQYISKFEVKPERWVFVPSKKCKKRGKSIVKSLLKRWQPPRYFFHFHKAGGHVAAMRPHTIKSYIATIDVSNFFGCVTRTKLKRALLKIGFSERQAFEISYDSCVKHEGRRFVPYGYVQSMAVASLALEKSAVGNMIENLIYCGCHVSVYVDDIIISHDDEGLLLEAHATLSQTLERTGFSVSRGKCQLPCPSVAAFNCLISDGLEISPHRMQQFIEDYRSGNDQAKASILRYVGVINAEQRLEIAATI